MKLDPITYNEVLRLRRSLPPDIVKIFALGGSYITPFDAVIDMLVVGGGASGGVIFGNGNVGGAGAGECAMLRGLYVPKNTSFNLTIGIGGTPVSRNASGQTPGVAGTFSRVSSGALGFTLRAEGGQPGGVAASSVFATGGVGGTGGSAYPVAGAEWHEGGPGGDAQVTGYGLAGAGAVNIIGTNLPFLHLRGGHNTTASGSAGGAGIGGRGGDKNHATAAGVAAGGGSGGSADDGASSAATMGPNALGMRTAASHFMLTSPTSFMLDYFGGGGYSANAPGPGGGSSGDTGANMRGSGIFGGMGGAQSVGSTFTLPQAGYGGGGAAAHGTTGTISSGRGGEGLIVFMLRRA